MSDWKPDYTLTPQRIVCAANRLPDGTIIIGIRHHDTIMRDTISNRINIEPMGEPWLESDQGFVDQFGKWLDRKESWLIACKANQIYRYVGSQTKEDYGIKGTDLYSENLY
jgi:hypothetical protein